MTDEDPAKPHRYLHRRLDAQLDGIADQFRQLARAQHRLQGLLDAVLSISRELELPEVLHRIVTTAMDLADAQYGALGVLHPSGRAMAQMPEAGFAAAVSRPSNLTATVHCRDLGELFEFTTGRVGTLPGVDGMEISPVFRRIKQAGTRVDGDRPSDPPSERSRL